MLAQLASAPDLSSYDRILVAFSGGKDSCAALLDLLEAGADPARIELHHHNVDGAGRPFMDWACTPAYCEAVAQSFEVPLFHSYREGGFWREMHRQDSPTAAVIFQDAEHRLCRVGGASPVLGTRQRFPQVTAQLSRRWCSPSLKIDVMDAVIRNQDRFLDTRTLVVTGERAEESAARRAYLTLGPHRTDTRNGKHRRRHVDHWRPVHQWNERSVWQVIERHGLVPHVAYQLGWSRLSCMTCVFIDKDLWATIRAVFPDRFEMVAEREAAFGVTIQRHASIRALADAGTPSPIALGRPDLIRQARDSHWRQPIRTREWRLPAGAYRHGGGPT